MAKGNMLCIKQKTFHACFELVFRPIRQQTATQVLFNAFTGHVIRLTAGSGSSHDSKVEQVIWEAWIHTSVTMRTIAFPAQLP